MPWAPKAAIAASREARAIRFVPALGGAHPARCTGCGACVAAYPAPAIGAAAA